VSTRKRSRSYWARKVHRYLGLFIGVQFIAWTVGGLYFSWTNLDEVHGDHLQAPRPHLRGDVPLVSPGSVLEAIRLREPVDSLVGINLAEVLGTPTYRVQYFSGAQRRSQLADATTGSLRTPVGRDEAVRIAQRGFAYPAAVRQVEYLTQDSVGRHHEYRAQPLPAWAISFDHPSRATAYVPAELGVVQRVRADRWRIFDFLWMLHTMDYAGRDNFNNLLLRAFSVLGLLTIGSGFLLFVVTSRPYRRRAQAARQESTRTRITSDAPSASGA
jgi:uncharacterized iron-regulated membrane protein